MLKISLAIDEELPVSSVYIEQFSVVLIKFTVYASSNGA